MRNFTKSFYDWCIETNNNYLLDLWDYDLNDLSPSSIGFRSRYKAYFKCPKGLHRSEQYTINNITGPKHQIVDCRRCHSFGQWCIDNNEMELLRRWDCELNKISPFSVSASSGKKFYFKCPLLNPLHKSELKILANVIKQKGSRRCIGCESFGQWCIENVDSDFMEKYWSDKNNINPFEITIKSTQEIWIKCQNVSYHQDYLIAPHNFVSGKRCPYCVGKKVSHNDSLGIKYPKILSYWADINDDTPFDYMPYSNKEKWFYCKKHGYHLRKICDVVKGNCECSMCNIEAHTSALQSKVNDYLLELGYQVLHEQNCELITINPKTGARLLYDNQVVGLNLFIEVNGAQHYQITDFTLRGAERKNILPEDELRYQQWKDEYKKNDVLNHGYSFLEIPYWLDDKTSSYKKIINDKINEILST